MASHTSQPSKNYISQMDFFAPHYSSSYALDPESDGGDVAEFDDAILPVLGLIHPDFDDPTYSVSEHPAYCRRRKDHPTRALDPPSTNHLAKTISFITESKFPRSCSRCSLPLASNYTLNASNTNNRFPTSPRITLHVQDRDPQTSSSTQAASECHCRKELCDQCRDLDPVLDATTCSRCLLTQIQTIDSKQGFTNQEVIHESSFVSKSFTSFAVLTDETFSLEPTAPLSLLSLSPPGVVWLQSDEEAAEN